MRWRVNLPIASWKSQLVCSSSTQQGLSMSDSPQTIERWDSLNHLKLITAIESEFGIRLRMQTVLKINDIAALVAAVQSHREE